MLIYQRWMKKSNLILYLISVKAGNKTLELLGIPDLHYRNQECPPKSGRFLRTILFFTLLVMLISQRQTKELSKILS